MTYDSLDKQFQSIRIRRIIYIICKALNYYTWNGSKLLTPLFDLPEIGQVSPMTNIFFLGIYIVVMAQGSPRNMIKVFYEWQESAPLPPKCFLFP